MIPSAQPYDQVVAALEARLGPIQDWAALGQALRSAQASWEQVEQAIAVRLGTVALHCSLRSITAPCWRWPDSPHAPASITLGNPLLALQMTRAQPEVALYAPLHLVVTADGAGATTVAYDRFVSLLAQYPQVEIMPVARQVEQKLAALVAEITAPSAG